ncbi:FG-GAP repeat domain-containing protein [Zobellia nedashkovskayae]
MMELLKKKKINSFDIDKHFEDQGVLFFDADNDKDQDLYVVSGSYEFFKKPNELQDRLYLNDGKGNFNRAENAIPEIISSGSTVISGDYDKDGDLDLFIGGRLVPGKYPTTPTSYLLENNKGIFKIVTSKVAPELDNIGMVTDATWQDITQDGSLDLIVTGEWMGIEVFENLDNKLVRSSKYTTLSETKGWWNKVLVADVDADGDMDIIAGNQGFNSKFHASTEDPFNIYADDFDENGSQDILLAKNYDGKQVPIRGKSCMTQQLPYLDKRIKTFEDFASRDLEGIIGKDLEKSIHYSVVEFSSGIFINNGHGKFKFNSFEKQIQKSPINSIIYTDFDNDGIKDIILAGNNYHTEVETTRNDAGIGVFLKGNKNGKFNYIPNKDTGLYLNGDVRDIEWFENSGKKYLIVTNNNEEHILYKLN